MCVEDLGIGGEGCRKTRTRTWVGKHVTGKAKTEIHTVLVERGLSWAEVQEKWAELTGDLEGFYISHQVCIFCRVHGIMAMIEFLVFKGRQLL